MRKIYLLIFIVIVFNIFFISHFIVLAQDEPGGLELRSFTPPPTRTRTPTTTPTLLPIETIAPTFQAEATPTPVDGSIGDGFIANPQDCEYIGMGFYNPQPRFLNRTMCSEGTFWPPFEPDYNPNNLVNLNNALGGKFWVRVNSIVMRDEVISNLEKLLKYMERQGCVPFIGYAYRSYQEQLGLWQGKNCANNPSCGVAPAGKSMHQAGIAADLFCAGISGGSLVELKVVPQSAIDNALNFGYVHPVTWDTPHFVGL